MVEFLILIFSLEIKLIQFFTVLAGGWVTLHESYYSCSKFLPFSLASSDIFCNSNAMLVNAMFITDLVQFWHTAILRHSVLFIPEKDMSLLFCFSVRCWTSTWRRWCLFYSMLMISYTIPLKTIIIQQLSDSQSGKTLLEGWSEDSQ